MKIDLNSIGSEGLTIERSYPPSVFTERQTGRPSPDQPAFLGKVQLRLQVRRTGERHHLRGKLGTEVGLRCCRCLVLFSFTVQPAFDYYLVPRRPVTEGAELEVSGPDRHEVEVDDPELDLVHLVEEQVGLSLPMKPLCRESCRGICPTCGAGLNEGDCSCSGEPQGPRLAGLSEMLEQLKNSKDK